MTEPHDIDAAELESDDLDPEVEGFTHAIVSPRDPASGLPTGKRVHKPFTVTSFAAITPILGLEPIALAEDAR